MHEGEAVRDEGTVEGTVLPSILPAPAPALWLPHALARRGPVRAKLAVEKIPFHPEKANERHKQKQKKTDHSRSKKGRGAEQKKNLDLAVGSRVPAAA